MHLTRHPAPMQALSHCQAVHPPARQKPKFSNNPSAKTKQIPPVVLNRPPACEGAGPLPVRAAWPDRPEMVFPTIPPHLHIPHKSYHDATAPT